MDCVLKEMKRKAGSCMVLSDSEQDDVSANAVLSLNLGLASGLSRVLKANGDEGQ